MKDFKNDSDTTLARFGRDKRARISSAERIERRPRLQRDAADSEQPYQKETARRASYNPHFYGGQPSEVRQFALPAPGLRRYGDDERPRRDGEARPTARRSAASAAMSVRSMETSVRARSTATAATAAGRVRAGHSATVPPVRDPHRAAGHRAPSAFDARGGEHQGDGKPFGSRNGGDRRFGDRKAGQHASKPAFRKENSKPASYPKYDPAKQTGEMRLNRFLAQSGICSRREADDFITAGLVSVNGQIVTELGTKVLPTDEVKFNDSRVQGEK